MLDALPDLADASSKILGFLVPRQITGASVAGIASQLQTKDSRENKNLRRLGSTFQVQRDVYGSESYINPRGILRVFLGSKGILGHDAERWRPDALLQKANLAVLTSNILSHSVQAQNDQLIEDLEQAFPISFVEGFVQSETPTPGSSALARETLQLALETRTQYAILSLARYAGQRNFDFDDVLHQVFYKNQTNLKGWAILGLRAEDLTHDVHDAILHRLKELRNAFAASPQNPTAGIKTLKEDYPWAIFVLQTIDWIGQRLSEIEMQIELHGGAETIHQSLSNEIQRRRFVDSTIDDAGDDVSSPLELIFEPPSETSLTTSDQRDIALLPARTTELQVSHFR